MKSNILSLLISFLTFIAGTLHAQEAIPASGGMAEGSEGSVSYSVGQVLYSLNSGVSGTVSEGIELPYEILIPIGIENPEKPRECMLYPNPASGKVTLKIDRADFTGLRYVVYDMTGNRMLEAGITSNKTTIPMEDLATGVYLVQITGYHDFAESYYIIKK